MDFGKGGSLRMDVSYPLSWDTGKDIPCMVSKSGLGGLCIERERSRIWPRGLVNV